jgi:hypothetical protein
LNQFNLPPDVKSKVADLFVSIGLREEVITIDNSEEEEEDEEQEGNSNIDEEGGKKRIT